MYSCLLAGLRCSFPKLARHKRSTANEKLELVKEKYHMVSYRTLISEFVKRESNLFNGKRREKNTISRQNWKRLHWRALVELYGQR